MHTLQQQQQPLQQPLQLQCQAIGTTNDHYLALPHALMLMCAGVQHAGSGHRMFLISTKQLAPAGAPDGRAQEFVVLGATGNGKQQPAMDWCGPSCTKVLYMLGQQHWRSQLDCSPHARQPDPLSLEGQGPQRGCHSHKRDAPETPLQLLKILVH
jgi:hypothetical protein